jgi:hypothetical protein
MSVRNLRGGNISAHASDYLTAIFESFVQEFWSLDVSQPSGPPWPVRSIAFPVIRISEELLMCIFRQALVYASEIKWAYHNAHEGTSLYNAVCPCNKSFPHFFAVD